MDPFIFLTCAIVLMTAATYHWLASLDRANARAELTALEHKLNAEAIFSPEPYESYDAHERYEQRCQELREQMASIIDRHGIHPFDSIKPF